MSFFFDLNYCTSYSVHIVNANTVDGQVAETTREDKLTLDLLDAIENQENISH